MLTCWQTFRRRRLHAGLYLLPHQRILAGGQGVVGVAESRDRAGSLALLNPLQVPSVFAAVILAEAIEIGLAVLQRPVEHLPAGDQLVQRAFQPLAIQRVRLMRAAMARARAE